MAYCLDTNTIVFCLRGKSAKAMNRLRTASASEVRVPMQVPSYASELKKAPSPSRTDIWLTPS